MSKRVYEPETEDVSVEAAAPVQLTKEMLSPEHRTKAKAKLMQPMSPEVMEGNARVGLWLIEGNKTQFTKLSLVTGLPEYSTPTDEQSGQVKNLYAFTVYVDTATDADGKQHKIGKLCTIRMQGTAVKAATDINSLIFDAPADQDKVAVVIGVRHVKGTRAAWFVPTVEAQELTDELLQAAQAAGL